MAARKKNTQSPVQMDYTPSVGSTESYRFGIGISSGVYNGTRRVQIGNAFVDEDGGNHFLKNVTSLTPEQAREVAAKLNKAADDAEKLALPQAVPAASAIDPTNLTQVIASAVAAALAPVANRIEALEKK